MIKTRTDLEEYIAQDNKWYQPDTVKRKLINSYTCGPAEELKKYLYYLRHFEYHYNNSKGSRYHTYLSFYYERRKNRLGNRLGIEIGPNCFGKGLTIWHTGSIIVNPNVRAGNYCVLHGNNCLGNSGSNEAVPVLGDYVDVGFGAVLIGPITISDGTRIGANAVVNRTINEPECTLVGIPARTITKREKNT